jgi:hypothetical protein
MNAALRRVLAKHGWVELPYEQMTRARVDAAPDGMHFQADVTRPMAHVLMAVLFSED